MAGPTAEEQLYIELINETRLDPMGNAARYITSYAPLISSNPAIQSALNFFHVNGAALQAAYAALIPVGPLAWNEDLGEAAQFHNAAMIAADDQEHQLPGEPDLVARITAAGYTNWSNLGENIYAYSESTLYGHAGFMVDWGPGADGMQTPPGHRINIMNANLREIGVDVTAEASAATTVGPQVVTQDFGARFNTFFVLGVAYSDSDANRFYSLGEGRGDLAVTVGAASTTSAASGGYSLQVATGPISVTLSGGGLSGALTLSATIAAENIKLDVVDGNTLLSSGSIVVTSGTIAVVRGLGVRGLSLSAGAGNQTVEGNAGNDTLTGGAGNDTVVGNGGTDTAVYTGNQADYLITKEGQNYRLIDQRAGGGDGNDLTIGIERYQFADGVVLAANLVTVSNSSPIAGADKAATVGSSPVTISVLANDTDADGDALSVTSAGDPPHGMALVNGNGTITYTPDAGFTGVDSFTYAISDGKGGTATGSVTVTVTAPNSAPVADADGPYAATEDSALIVTAASGVLAGDIDPDGDALVAVLVDGTDNGALVLDPDGSFTYQPNPDFNGADSFSYQARDTSGALSAVRTVAITIAPVNDAPVAFGDGPYAATEDTTLTVPAAQGVTANDIDVDGDTVTASLVSTTSHGTLTLLADGSFTYTPDANFNGADSFTYRARDPSGALSANRTVSIQVAAVNDAPQARDDVARLLPNGTATIAVLANDTDADGDTLSVAGAGDPLHGTAAVTAGGKITYVPDAGYTGQDSFTYTVSDAKGGTGTATVDIIVGDPRFRLFAVDGFVGAAKGAGTIFGANGFQDITILAGSGTVSLDGSFTRGNDIVRLEGNAASYTIERTASSAVLKQAATEVTIPLGTAGLALVFDDGVRELVFDLAANSARIGGQSFDTAAVAVTAPPDGTALPMGGDAAAAARLALAQNAEVSIAGNFTVFGSNGLDVLHVLDGSIALDGSFGRGGDTLTLPDATSGYQAYLAGSQLVLVGADDDTISVPIGTAGMLIGFSDEDRSLRYDMAIAKVLLGDQAISATSIATAEQIAPPAAPASLEIISYNFI